MGACPAIVIVIALSEDMAAPAAAGLAMPPRLARVPHTSFFAEPSLIGARCTCRDALPAETLLKQREIRLIHIVIAVQARIHAV